MPHLYKTRRHDRSSWNSYVVVDVALDVVEPECALVIWHGSARPDARDGIDETEIEIARASAGACFALCRPDKDD